MSQTETTGAPPAPRDEIATLPARLPVIGNIKIGGMSTGDRAHPVKFDHFRVTKRTRGADGNFELDREVHAALGTDKPTTLDVRLPFDTRQENLYAQMVFYAGRTRQTHRCDGITCLNPETGQARPCDRANGVACPCKTYARLAVHLEAAPSFGGLYEYRTTSYASVAGFQTFLRTLEHSLGSLRGLPLKMVLFPAEVTYGQPGDRKIGTAYRVALELRRSWEEAKAEAIAFHQSNRVARSEILALAAGTRAELDQIDREEEAEIAAEFFPASEPDAPAPPPADGAPAGMSPVGDLNASLVEDRIGELRELLKGAHAAGVQLTDAQAMALDEALESGDLTKLTQSVNWIRNRLPKNEGSNE